MAEREANRNEEFLIQQQPHRVNAFNLILKMLGWCQTNETRLLMDEMLHSIFFLAKISTVPFSPEEIITNYNMLQALLEKYPNLLRHLSQFPKRTPFSSVLDMVILKENPENEDGVMRSLQAIVNDLRTTFPVSSTVCVSQDTRDPSSRRHYGVSMRTPGCYPRNLMIAASCCGPWDDYVAGAVMTFLPNNRTMETTPEFDGAFKLPDYVRCEAFHISTGERKAPCRSCGKMFGLPTEANWGWPCGNCAEAESVSNLLKHESGVKRDVIIPSPIGTDEIRKRVQHDVCEKLKDDVRNKLIWKGDFYTPYTA